MTTAIKDIEASEVEVINAKLKSPFSKKVDVKNTALSLVKLVSVEPGQLCITLSDSELGNHLGIAKTRFDADALRISEAFQLRRKGVENRIVLGDAPAEFDQTLISNIVKARNWYADICKGTGFAEIAKRDGTSPRRVQAIIDLVFLSPAILDKVAQGTQPIGLTIDYLVKSGFPVYWKEQEKLFATLG